MGLTAQGYEKRQPSEIKEVIIKELQNAGSPFLELPADIQNNLIDSAIPIMLQFENIAAEIINGYGPDYANDYIWLNLANSLGLTRKSKVKASVELKFTGEPGTYIPKDTEVGAFKTDESITLDSTGTALVQAYSESDVFAEAETLTDINATIADDLEVTNPEASIEALEEESVADLRQRVKTILRSSRKGAIDYALARLKAVKGVNPQLIKFRFLDYNYQVSAEETNVLKNVRGIEAIVGGGDANQIAGVLFDSFLETAKLISQPSNNEVDRTINSIVRYYGSELPISFTRPKNLPLKFRMIFTFRGVIITSTSAEGVIKQPFTDFINNRQLGAPLNKNTLDMFIFSKFAEHGIGTTGFVNIKYAISKGEETIEFDSEGFITEIKHDCYLTLAGLQIEIASSQGRQEFGNIPDGGGSAPSTPSSPPAEESQQEPGVEDAYNKANTTLNESYHNLWKAANSFADPVDGFRSAGGLSEQNAARQNHGWNKLVKFGEQGTTPTLDVNAISRDEIEQATNIAWSSLNPLLAEAYATKPMQWLKNWILDPQGEELGEEFKDPERLYYAGQYIAILTQTKDEAQQRSFYSSFSANGVPFETAKAYGEAAMRALDWDNVFASSPSFADLTATEQAAMSAVGDLGWKEGQNRYSLSSSNREDYKLYYLQRLLQTLFSLTIVAPNWADEKNALIEAYKGMNNG